MALDYMKIFPDVENVISEYDDEQKGRLLLAMMRYAFHGEEPIFDGAERFVWPTLRQKVDACESKVERMKANGSKGGRPRNPETDENQEKANERKEKQVKANESSNNHEHDQEHDHEQEHEHDQTEERGAKPPKPPAASRRFTPPIVSDVAAYCRERGNAVDAQRFVDFYTAKGWRVGNQTMRDWKAAVRTWEGRETRAATGQAPRPADAMQRHSYTQEDYSRMVVDLDAEGGGT